MKFSKNLMLAVLATVIASPVSAAPTKKAAKAAPKAEQAVVVKETSHDPVVRSSNGLKVRVIGEGTGVIMAPMNQGKAKKQNLGKGTKVVFAMDETNIGLVAEGKTPKFGELEYGLKVTLTMDKYNDPQAGSSSVLKDSFMHFGNAEKYGTFYLGNIKGAEYRTVNTVTPVLGGLGSYMYNDWMPLLNPVHGWERTELELEGKTTRASKIMYVSPRMNGAQVTVSYTPNSKHNGFGALQSHALYSTSPGALGNIATLRNDKINPIIKKYHTDSFAAGVNYKYGFSNGAAVETGAALISSSTTTHAPGGSTAAGYNPEKLNWYRRVLSYTLGVMGTYRGYEMGVQWIDNGKSGQAREFSGRDAGKIIAAALGYNFGEHKVSLGYSHFVRRLGTTPTGYVSTDATGAANATVGANTNLGKTKVDGVTAVYTQQVAEGLKIFGEYGIIRQRTTNDAFRISKAHDYTSAVPSNTTHAIITGLQINF